MPKSNEQKLFYFQKQKMRSFSKNNNESPRSTFVVAEEEVEEGGEEWAGVALEDRE